MITALLVLVFVVLPIIEISVALQVAHHIGGPETILLLIAFSIIVVWLAKRAGFSIVRSMRFEIQEGKVPANGVIDAVLVFAAGVLLFVPGFVTGIVGLVLLLPPVRMATRNWLKRRVTGRVYRLGPGPGRGPDVIDV